MDRPDKVTLDREKGVWISKQAVKMLQNNEFPFDKPEVIPDAIIPKNVEKGSLEHALYLFYAVNFDSRRLARKVYASARAVVEEVGAREILTKGREDLTRLIEKHLEEKTNTPEILYDNCTQLMMKYGGDPRKMFEDRNLDLILKRIKEFKQYGIGKACLLFKNYMRFGIAHLDNPYSLPVKVDRHLTRMSIGTGVLTLEPAGRYRREQFDNILRPFYQEICMTEKINPVELDDALWVIGSNLCVKKDKANCEMNCALTCYNMGKMDRQGSYFDTRIEVRKRHRTFFEK